jgi:hypothetical protein
LNDISYPDHAGREDFGAKAAPMHQAARDPVLRQVLEMRARLTKPNSAERDLTHSKATAHQVVQRDPTGYDIATRVPRLEFNFIITF